MSKYLSIINNGNFIYHTTQSFILIIWVIFINSFLNIYKKNYKQSSKSIYINIFTYILLATPFIIFILNFYNNIRSPNPEKKVADTTAFSAPPEWSFCLNTKKQNKEILGTYNFQCREKNNAYLEQTSKDLITRFYYLNYICFYYYHSKMAYNLY